MPSVGAPLSQDEPPRVPSAGNDRTVEATRLPDAVHRSRLLSSYDRASLENQGASA